MVSGLQNPVFIESRILGIASGGQIAARILICPPHRGHSKKSIENDEYFPPLSSQKAVEEKAAHRYLLK